MFYATYSFIDYVIGPKVNGDLVLPGMNVNDNDSMS